MIYLIMKCPFCKREVKAEYEAVSGCKLCVKEWINNMNIDHEID